MLLLPEVFVAFFYAHITKIKFGELSATNFYILNNDQDQSDWDLFNFFISPGV